MLKSELKQKVMIRCAECGKLKPYYASDLWVIQNNSPNKYCTKACAKKAVQKTGKKFEVQKWSR